MLYNDSKSKQLTNNEMNERAHCETQEKADSAAHNSQPNPKPAKKKEIRVFFKSLRKRTDQAAIEQVFSKYGDLQLVRLPFSETKKKNLGYGYVVFKDQEIGMDMILHVKRVKIEGKIIKLREFDVNRQKKYKEVENLSQIVRHYSRTRHGAANCDNQNNRAVDPQLEFLCRHRANQKKVSAYHTLCNLHVIKPTHTYYHRVGRDTAASEASINYEWRLVNRK